MRFSKEQQSIMMLDRLSYDLDAVSARVKGVANRVRSEADHLTEVQVAQMIQGITDHIQFCVDCVKDIN